MGNLLKIPLIDEKNKTAEGEPAYRCVVESPRGSAVKFTYDPELRAFVFGNELIKGLTYPFDWGFLPSTLGADGDPLDVMIFHDAASTPGIVVSTQIIGVLEVEQREEGGKPERNDRFLAVPVKSHREDSLNEIEQLSKRMRAELEEFFQTTSCLSHRKLDFLGWRGAKRAKALIEEGAARFKGRK